MKKLLAMVLALVMTLSLAVSASAFTDDKDVSADYAEAVAVLNGMDVFKGYEDGSFKPQGNITRAEVATIIYRIYTGDVAKSDKSGLYATYNKFSDMTGAGWAAGYIGYCANAELVKGYPDGTFKPSGNVTGYEVLAMILRAIGYDKNGEFSGSDWSLNVAKYAEQLGILDNVDKTTNLGAPATRELVAEMLFEGIQQPMVTYTPAFNYVTDKVADLKQTTLGYKNFKLVSGDDEDIWGRPTTVWAKDANKNGTYDEKDTTVYATIVATPDASFHEPTTQCDICEALGEKTSAKVVEIYTNGVKATAANTYKATETKAKVGEQGQIAEYYKVDGGYRLVVIDTYLAKVTDVVEEKTDSKGHTTRDDCLQLSVWTAKNETPATIYVEGNDYAEDAYILVHVNAVDKTDIITVTNAKATPYPTVEVVGEAKSFTGAQSKIYHDSNKHAIGGEDYMDAYRFYKDVAEGSSVKYTWFLDQFGNLIGNDKEDNASYAVLQQIYWTGSDRTGYAEAILLDMDGETRTVKVDSIDGINTEDINKTDLKGDEEFSGAFVKNLNGATPRVSDSNTSGNFDTVNSKTYAYMSTWDEYNKAYNGMALFRVETNDDGSVNLQGYDEVKSTQSKDVRFVEYAEYATLNPTSSVLSVFDSEDATTSSSKYALTSNTKFVVRELNDKDEYVYNTDVTLRTLKEYADKGVEVYFVVDGKYVTDVYIKNAIDASTFGTYIFVPDTDSAWTTDPKTGNHYFNVYIDGKAQTIEVESDTVAQNLTKYEGKLLMVTGDAKETWSKSLNSKYGMLKTTANLVVVNEETDAEKWVKNEVIADYISDYQFKEDDNTILVSLVKDGGADAEFNVIDLDNATIVVWDDANAKDVKITKDTFEAYGVWAVTAKTDYEGSATTLYLGKQLGTTATATVYVNGEAVEFDKNLEATVNGTDGAAAKVTAVASNGATATVKGDSTFASGNKATVEVKSEDGVKSTTYTVNLGVKETVDFAITTVKGYDVTAMSANSKGEARYSVTLASLDRNVEFTSSDIKYVGDNVKSVELVVLDDSCSYGDAPQVATGKVAATPYTSGNSTTYWLAVKVTPNVGDASYAWIQVVPGL